MDIVDKIEHYGYTVNNTLLRDSLQTLVQSLMDIEVSQILDASRYERSRNRRAYRNGYRTTLWSTPIGAMELRIPKLRQGTYYPEQLLNDANLIEKLINIVKACIVLGVNNTYTSNMLHELGYVNLSVYDMHQICEALQNCLDNTDDNVKSYDIDGVIQAHIPLHYRKFLRLMQRHVADGKLERISNEKTKQLDSEFWKDFARRMSQAGAELEDYQSVLSSINPYAQLQLDEVPTIIQPELDKLLQPIFEYQLIA